MAIRVESPDEAAEIGTLVRRAFGRDGVPCLVAHIRASANYVPDLALVASRGGKLVGHVMLSYVDLVDGEARHRVLTLSPLCVAPESQRQGIGATLMMAAIEKADRRSEPLIVLEGNPRYYARFGFRTSRRFGITVPLPDGVPEDAAMVRTLSAYDRRIRGEVVYPPAFDFVTAA